LSTISVLVPRFFVDGHDGRSALGVYAALSYVFAAGSMLTTALSNVSVPRFARSIRNEDRAGVTMLMRRFGAIVIAAGAGGVVFGVVLGRWFLATVFGPEYAAEASALVWLTVATALSLIAALFNHVVLASRRYNVQVWVQALVAVAITVTSAILVPRFGISGAAISLAVAMLLQCFGNGIAAAAAIRHIGVRPHHRVDLRSPSPAM
jgi:O-antigen/teichoic acid export membrane protein